jgi:urease accessory protein
MKTPLLALGSVALLPQAALAHAGDHGAAPFLAGALHPLGGADHVLAMVAVGLLAAVSGGRALWALPAGFAGAMLVGGLLGATGVGLHGVEPMILASVVLTGVLAALALRLPLAAMVAVVAGFGLFHGHAHGAEGPAAGLALYAAGFGLTTLALHLAGLATGLALEAAARRGAIRVLGAGTAVAGLVLAFV